MGMDLYWMPDWERRVVPITEQGARLTGYAALFDSLSENMGGFSERIACGAFRDVLTGDTRALMNHDPNFVLGRTKAGTLKLKEDQKGLLVEIFPPDTAWARDLVVSIKRGDVSQMSFGFGVDPEGEEWSKSNGSQVRTIRKVARLYDVSVVTYPAYSETSVSARSRANSLDFGKKPVREMTPFQRKVIRTILRASIKIAEWKEREQRELDELEFDAETEILRKQKYRKH